MPHLHLPADHTDADLVLAATVAASVGSADLYVSWTHDDGAGAVPEVEALVRPDRPSALATMIAGLLAGAGALWRRLTNQPPPAAQQPPARREASAEPSA